jgi:hypothetical protein
MLDAVIVPSCLPPATSAIAASLHPANILIDAGGGLKVQGNSPERLPTAQVA